MNDDPHISPAELSAFDQAFAHSSALLDELIRAHHSNVDRLAAAGLPDAAAIYGLSRYLLDDLPYEAVSSVLAVAVTRIDRAMRAAT